MAGDNKDTALAFGAGGVGALIGAAIMAARQSKAGSFSLDQTTKDLLVAIAAASGDTDENVQAIKDLLAKFGGSNGTQFVVSNTRSATFTRTWTAIAGVAVRLATLIVPDTMELVLKGWPTNGNVIYIAESQPAAQSPGQGAAYPLLPNETLHLKIHDASVLWVASFLNPGDSVVYGAEQV